MVEQNKLRICCNSLFSDTKTSNKDLEEVQSLTPVTETRISKRKLPQISTFDGAVQTYLLEGNGDHNLLQSMVDRKQIIDENIEEAVQAEPKKVQLSAKIELEKLGLEDATDPTIFVNSQMETVDVGKRLTEDSRCWVKCYRVSSVLLLTEVCGCCSERSMVFALIWFPTCQSRFIPPCIAK